MFCFVNYVLQVIYSLVCVIRLHCFNKILLIRKNIQNFGGNPSSVTLYGVSAGGISATALAVSEMSRGLFHRVVAGSGVFTMPLTWGSDHEKKASR